MTREEIARAARGLGQPGHDARDRISERLCQPRRPALRLARQARRPRASQTIAAAGEAGGAVHHRHPDRHRRDARGAHRRAARHCATCTAATATSRKSSSRTSAPRPAPRWPAPRSRTSSDLLWTVAVARLLLGPGRQRAGAAQSQRPASYERLIGAGINDWGGISPVTIDHVNPEAPWPEIDGAGRARPPAPAVLVERLPVYPALRAGAGHMAGAGARHAACARSIDADGLAREDRWTPGVSAEPRRSPAAAPRHAPIRHRSRRAIASGQRRAPRSIEPDIVRLFAARDAQLRAGARARADELRRERQRRRRALRRQPQHQLHQHLLLTAAASAPSPRARSTRPCAASPTTCSSTEIVRRVREAWAARRHRGLPAGRHPSRLHGRHLHRHRARHPRAPSRTCTSTPSRRWRSAQGAATLGIPVARFPAAAEGRGPRHAARHGRRDPRRRGARRAVPRQAEHRRMARRHAGRAPGRAAHDRDHHVRPHRAAGALGAPPARRSRPAGARPAASPSSCRCPSCTWKRRCTCAAAPARARPGARPC